MISCLCAGYMGRLGNSMFQYAAMVGTAYKNGMICTFDYDNPGNLGSHFSLSIPMPGKRDIITGKILHNYQQPKFCYDSGIEKLEEYTDIKGYFQSSRFFDNVKNEIKQEFTPIDPVRESCEKIRDAIRKEYPNKEMVSVHVRRGDYTYLKDHHPPCEPSYYQAATSIFPSEKYVFLIFSDDLPWCQQVFGDQVHYVQGGTAVQDMHLMSLCDHHIIANSSFSWWGAWLGHNENKKVIAPKNWFGPAKKPEDYPMHDLYEKEWTII